MKISSWIGYCAGAALMVIGVVDAGPSAAQTEQAPDPAVKQFGPRVNKQSQQNQQPTGQGQQRRQGPPPEVIAKNGDWTLTCETQAGQKGPDGKPLRACGMVQTSTHSERTKVAISLVLVQAKQQGQEATMMRVTVPIGVYLPTGIALEVDGEAVGRVPFTRCLPRACLAIAAASDSTLEKLKKGSTAKFIIYEAPGAGLGVDFGLKGFTKTLKQMQEL